MPVLDAIDLTLFCKQLTSICDEMGDNLRRTAFSANIKERLDYSCAIFDREGKLCAQAAHIPVHLGSMAYAMTHIVQQLDWRDGDSILLNDPYNGGTHLPDVTLITPLFYQQQLAAFLVNRAHYADIGSETPGSMPLATSLSEEGVVIAPIAIQTNHKLNNKVFKRLLSCMQNPTMVKADLLAQISSNHIGSKRLGNLLEQYGNDSFNQKLTTVNDYATQSTATLFESLPKGRYEYADYLDGDGFNQKPILINVSITIESSHITVDFNGTHKQVAGNLNCPLSVTAAAVYYCFYSLMPETTPACDGTFNKINIVATEGSLLNARPPAAVAAGNVETSSRVVDVVLGALAQAIPEQIPAASQGTMNNLAMGNANFSYYETLAGGMGASMNGSGQDARQCHMTNTANTPVEVLEKYMPLRIHQYAIRPHSGGTGKHDGGNGLIREYEFLEDCSISLLSERRLYPPWGLEGGNNAKSGKNVLNQSRIAGKGNFSVQSGDRLRIETPGGGGWGKEFA